MKNRNSVILIIGFLMLGLSSCNDFLEIPSKTNLTTAVYYKTQNDFLSAINGVYIPLRGLYINGANSGTGSWLMGEMRSDNTYYRFNPNFRATLDVEAIADFTNVANNAVPTNKYQGYYQVIARANQILATIDEITFDDPKVKDNIKGQALFLRAFSYFDLVQFFGSVPLHTVPSTSLGDVAAPFAEVSALYDLIIADATAAASLLPLRSQLAAPAPKPAGYDLGRASSGAAKTLLANVYIVQKNWSAAETLLKEIITSNEYSLVPNYADVFKTTNKNNSESIFEVQFRQGSDGYASNFIYGYMPAPMTPTEVATAFANYGVTPASIGALAQEGYNIPTPDLIADYEGGDLRFPASIGTANAGGVDYPIILKYLHPHTTFNLTDDNWPVYRYAEVLLFLSEALNEQGKSAEALTYLNQVRQRAGLADIASSATLSADILHERRIELAFENKRWLDLVRTGNAVTVMTQFGQNVLANPQAYYFPTSGTGSTGPASAVAFQDISILFPIPAAETQLRP